ncbi:MAG: SDR family oxidoreductase [Lentisphaerae bacterium]|nr:SDR family oxidoreductase [Lentisphaerota bacterium]
MTMRAVLVTGGVRRLGKAIGDSLADTGWRVLRSSSRPDSGADVVCDLSLPGSADELFRKAVAAAGGTLDAVVNNAALYVGADAESVSAVDFEAPRRLTELMASHGGGAVVNIIDESVLRSGADETSPRRARAPYVEAKRRLLDFTIRAAAEYASVGLRVNAVAPGPVLPPEGMHEKACATPLGRPTPQAVADAVRFLLEARFTTGVVIPVAGTAPDFQTKQKGVR